MSNHTPEPWKDNEVVNRFWSKVKKGNDKECWLWTKGTSGFGYGNFHYGRLSIRAHRFSYQLHFGLIKQHNCVCHSCDNPLCVNPFHLWLGTRAENNADAVAKKRNKPPVQLSGEGNSNVSLSTPEVIAVRVMSRSGMPQARIANYLGVSHALICLILKNDRRAEETEDRVSACFNACAGVRTETLEHVPLTLKTVEMVERIERAEKQCSELLSALKYHQEQTRPIQRTIDLINEIEN